MTRTYEKDYLEKKYIIKRHYYWRPNKYILNLLLFCAVIFLVGLMLVSFSVSTAAGQVNRLIIVHNGDTLWSIAQKTNPEKDPRETIEVIRNINHLNDVIVHPGQEILVP